MLNVQNAPENTPANLGRNSYLKIAFLPQPAGLIGNATELKLHGVDAVHQFIEQLALLLHDLRLLASNSAWIAFFNTFFSSVVRSAASTLS